MIWLGIDDTDMPGTPGTNQLARKLAHAVRGRYRCLRIVRHQLCSDARIPCTSKNGSASLLFEPLNDHDRSWLLPALRRILRDDFIPGSDPGLCLAERVPDPLRAFGRRAQRSVVTQQEARSLAARCGVSLEGLGGTEDGVIGALAAVGLAVGGNDGRVVQWDRWGDDLSGIVDWAQIAQRGVIVHRAEGGEVRGGRIDVGKKLRPNCRNGRIVLTVVPEISNDCDFVALKLP